MPHLRAALADALGPLYRVEREVRPLGDCRLFVVRATPDGPELLVKVLPGALSLALDAAVFERELLLLGDRLQDARLVRPAGGGRAGSAAYYTRSFVAGTTLHAALQRHGALPLARAVEVLHDVLTGLARAHAAHIPHGDLRPENVLLADSHALVADTGVAGALSRSLTGSAPHAAIARLCARPYVAPERREADAPPTPRADVYAVGVLLHEMLAGAPPQPDGDPLDAGRELPAWMVELSRRCLADEPGARWAHAGDALATLPSRH